MKQKRAEAKILDLHIVAAVDAFTVASGLCPAIRFKYHSALPDLSDLSDLTDEEASDKR